MARRNKPVLVQIETQGRITLVLLPLVAALPFLSDEMIARIFGQTMATLNWARDIGQRLSAAGEIPVPNMPKWPPYQIAQKTTRTKEEQRAYWREAKREERRRKRESRD